MANFGEHAATMIQSMWQHDTYVVTQFSHECMDIDGDPGPHQISPKWLEIMYSSLLHISPLS